MKTFHRLALAGVLAAAVGGHLHDLARLAASRGEHEQAGPRVQVQGVGLLCRVPAPHTEGNRGALLNRP